MTETGTEPVRAPPRTRRPVLLAVLAFGVVVLLALAVRWYPTTPSGHDALASALDGLKVGRLGWLHVEGVDGDPWGRATVRRLTIRDKQGVWLDARNIAISWRPTGLLTRQVHVDSLAVGRATVLRRLTLLPGGPPSRSPVSIRLDHISGQVETLPAFSVNRGLYAVIGHVRINRAGAPTGSAEVTSLLRAGDMARARFAFGKKGRFALELAAREAKGGALGGALGLPANQDFALFLELSGQGGKGDLSLAVRSGAIQAARASGHWSPDGGAGQGEISLASSTLLAPYAAALGPDLRLAARGSPLGRGLYRIHLTGQADKIAFSARGEFDAAHRATGPHGVALSLRLADPTRLVKTGASGPLALDAGLGGDSKRWALKGRASVERPKLGVSFTRVSGPFQVQGEGRRVTIAGDLAAEGGQGGGLVGALLGPRPTARAQVQLIGDGRVIVRDLAVTGAGLTLKGAGEQGLFGDLSFSASANVSNVGRVMAGARGAADADLSARQSGKRPWTFQLKARGRSFASGMQELDRLLGPAPTLKASGAFDGKTLSLATASLDGASAGATLAGKIGPNNALKLAVTWRAAGPLPVGPLEIDGAAKGTGDIGGTILAPTADLLANFSRIDAPSLTLRDARIALQLQSGGGTLQGRVSLLATSVDGPARASGLFRVSGPGLEVSDLDAAAGGLALKGSLSLANGAPSRADLAFSAGPGAFLVRGHAAGHVRITEAPGGARAEIAAQGADLLLPSGPAIRTLKLTASGPLNHLPYRADASGVQGDVPWRLDGGGVFSQAASTKADNALTFEGSGRVRRVDFKTSGPARVAFGPAGLSVNAAVLAAGGRAEIALQQGGGAVRGRATLTSVSLTAIDPDLVGQVSGQATLEGRQGVLSGALDAHLAKAALKGAGGKAVFDGEVRAQLAGQAVTLTADLSSTGSGTAHITAALPVHASASPFSLALDDHRPMSGQFAIDGEVGPLWDVMMGDTQTLTGRLVASGSIGGTLADPRALGTASLTGGRFADASTGLKLQDVSLQATLGNTAVEVTHLDGRDAGRGRISGSGRVGLERNGVSSLVLDLQDFRLLDNEFGQATASGQVSVNRAANGKVRLSGALTIDRAQISPKTPTPSGVVPMDVVEIHKPVNPDAAPEVKAARPSPVDLDVTLTATGGVLIKGRGLNVELSLRAKVVGDTSAPVLTGEARVVRGEYDFAGQRFTFSDNSVVHLSSDPGSIRLDLTATRDDPTLTAVIRITGTAEKPVVTLTSTPALPQDEVLSQVLFGTSVSTLNGFQAAQLASALSGLASGGGFDVIGGLRNLAHLDRLAINSSPTLGNSVAGGKYLSNNLYVEVSGGAREGPGAQVEWRIRRHLAIVSKVTSQGGQTLSIRWRKDY